MEMNKGIQCKCLCRSIAVCTIRHFNRSPFILSCIGDESSSKIIKEFLTTSSCLKKNVKKTLKIAKKVKSTGLGSC